MRESQSIAEGQPEHKEVEERRNSLRSAGPPKVHEDGFTALAIEEGYKIEHKSGYKPWKLNGYTRSGLRVRDSFKCLKEAVAKRKELIRQDLGVSGRTQLIETPLSQAEAEDAEEAIRLMKELPMTGWDDSKWTLKKCVSYVKTHIKICRNPKSCPEAIDEFIAAKEKANRRSATLRGLKHILGRLRVVAKGKNVDQVKPDELEPLVRRGNAETQETYRKKLSQFFDWCAGKPRFYTPSNPCADIVLDVEDAIEDESPVAVMPVDHVRSIIFDALTFRGGRLFLYVLIGFFQSLRPSELVRCQARLNILGEAWAFFGENDEENYIDVIGKTRTRKARHVKMYAALAIIVKRFIDAGFPLVPTGWYKDFTLLRARNGYLGRKRDLPKGFKRDGLIPYPPDIMRHTGTSHKLNHCKSEGETGLWSGDTADVIVRHYKGKVTDKETRMFLQILADLVEVLPTVEDLKRIGAPDPITDKECSLSSCPVDKPNTFSMRADDFKAKRAAFLQKNPGIANRAQPKRRPIQRYCKRFDVIPLLPRERKEQIRFLWSSPRRDICKKFDLAGGTYDILFGDELKLPLPGKTVQIWRAGALNIDELPQEVRQAFPEGLPLAAGRQYIPLPKLVSFVWSTPKRNWKALSGFSVHVIEQRLQGLPVPPDYPPQVLPDEIKALVVLSEEELFRIAKKNRNEERKGDTSYPAKPSPITLHALLKRAWEVDRKFIREQWNIPRLEIETMLRDLPTPERDYWRLPKTKRVIPEEVIRLLEMTELELAQWKSTRGRERFQTWVCSERPQEHLEGTPENERSATSTPIQNAA